METVNIKELNDRIQKESAFVDIISMEMNKVIVGQKHLVENLLIGLLADGHILLEGMPGLAKTLAINTLANIVDAKFNRIQFTPDLLPADVIGTMIYSQKSEQFQVKQGPIFANFVLADEINRSPAKVQSALVAPHLLFRLFVAFDFRNDPLQNDESFCIAFQFFFTATTFIRSLGFQHNETLCISRMVRLRHNAEFIITPI